MPITLNGHAAGSRPERLVLFALLALTQVAAQAQVNCTVNGASLNMAGSVYMSANSLSVLPGGQVNVENSTLQIAGALSNTGAFTAVNGTIIMNGSYSQTIPASAFTGNKVKNLVIANNSGVNLSGPLSVSDVLTISSGNLATGGFLTLTSTATGTARVAPITSAAPIPVNGNVTVERYVPGRRSYRLITSSVTTSTASVLSPGEVNSSIWANWQNSGNNADGNSGTFITGGSNADGFDPQLANASLYTYNGVSRQFTPFTSANGKNTRYTPLKAGIAYYMFIYGDRVNSVAAGSPNSTVLRATGTLITGDQTYNSSSSIPLSAVTGRYTLLGNPFASPIDWSVLSSTDLAGTYWGWDPNLSSTGGYVTVSKSGSVVLIAPFSGTTGLNQYIQPGQGFFVQTTGPSPQLTIREQDKVSTFNGSAFRTLNATRTNEVPLMAVNLLYANGGNTVLADGALAAFSPEFSTGINREDAAKIQSGAEGIGIINGGQLLSIDGRPMPQDKDTLFLSTTRLARSKYTLQLFAREMNGSHVSASLEDSYLNISRPLSMTDTNNVPFEVDFAQSASYNANRFRIVFNPSALLPLTFTGVNAELKNRDVQVGWEVADETGIQRYDVEYAVEALHFRKVAEVTPRNRNGAEWYSWLDVNPAAGSNYYRIRAILADGTFSVSKVAMVKMEIARSEVKIYPNPVKNKQITYQITGAHDGQLKVGVYNNTGQIITQRMVEYHAGTLNHIYLGEKIQPGFYHVQIDGKDIVHREMIFIE